MNKNNTEAKKLSILNITSLHLLATLLHFIVSIKLHTSVINILSLYLKFLFTFFTTSTTITTHHQKQQHRRHKALFYRLPYESSVANIHSMQALVHTHQASVWRYKHAQATSFTDVPDLNGDRYLTLKCSPVYHGFYHLSWQKKKKMKRTWHIFL